MGTTENGRDLLRLVKCATKSKTPQQMLQTFLDRISSEIVDDVNIPSEENIEMVEHVPLLLKQHQVTSKSGNKGPLREESDKYFDITSKPNSKMMHKYPSKYKRRNLKKITKLKQKLLKSKIPNLSKPQIVQTNFKKGDLKSSFEKKREPGDKSSFHKCAVCDKSFAKIGNLNVHMIIHSEEKPYQ